MGERVAAIQIHARGGLASCGERRTLNLPDVTLTVIGEVRPYALYLISALGEKISRAGQTRNRFLWAYV